MNPIAPPAPYVQTIGRVRAALAETFDQVDSWFDKPSAVRAHRPASGGWTIDEVLEHITLTSHFLMIVIRNSARTALKRAAAGAAIAAGESDLDLLEPIGRRGTFTWSRPEHMIPTGTVASEAPYRSDARERGGVDLTAARFLSLRLPLLQSQPHLDFSRLLVNARSKRSCVLAEEGLNVVGAVHDDTGEFAMRTFADDEEGPDAGQHQLIELVSFPADVLVVRQGHPAAIPNESQPCGIWNVVESKVLCVGLDAEPACCKLRGDSRPQIPVGKECDLRRLVRRGSPRQFRNPLGRNRGRRPLGFPRRRAARRWSRCGLPFRRCTAGRRRSAGR